MKDTRSNSGEQSKAEHAIRSLLQTEFGALSHGHWVLSDGSKIEVDAISETRGVAVEIFARQGRLLDGQRKKIAKDVLKLALIGTDAPEESRPLLVIAHANPAISKYLAADTWLAQAARIFRIETRDLSEHLAPDLKASVLRAEGRQGERFRSAQP